MATEKNSRFGRTLGRLFLHAAQEFSDLPALYVESNLYNYHELEKTAASIASSILKHDPAPGTKLGGVFAYRSLPAYAGTLGQLLAGKGYVPLNPTFPNERNLRMLDLSGIRTLILDRTCEQSAREVLARCKENLLVLLPEHRQFPDWTEQLTRHLFILCQPGTFCEPTELRPEDDPEGIAYLLFTSGSTGIPKGVVVSHNNVVSYLDTVAGYYHPGPEDRFTQFFDMTFDLSVHDIFLSLLHGACIYCTPENPFIGLVNFIRDNKLTFWFSVPSTIGFMEKLHMLKPGSFPSLKWSLFCGEPLPASLASAWQEAAPNSTIENLYGPTETTIAITSYCWQKGLSENQCVNGIVPIGKPFPGQQAVAVNSDLHVLGPGEQGELCLAGSQVSPGYWHNQAETDRRFVTIPGLEVEATGWYRTGDLVEFHKEVGFCYLGRLDRQVKIRGHRVEIPEIENVIRKISGASLVAVLCWPLTESGADGVIAYLCGSNAPEDRIIKQSRKYLPDYMVPTEVFFLPEFPLNPSGKVDYNRLLEMRKEMDSTR